EADIDRQGQILVEAWDRHLTGLVQLAVAFDEASAALSALAEWAVGIAGDNPARTLLVTAQQHAAERHAQRGAAFDSRFSTLTAEATLLEEERSRLEGGID